MGNNVPKRITRTLVGIPAIVALLCTAVLGVGCSGAYEQRVVLDLEIGESTEVDVDLSVPGPLPDSVRRSLENEGWDVSTGNEDWSMERRVEAEDFDDQIDVASAALAQCFESEEGFPLSLRGTPSLDVTSRDYLFFTTYKAELELPRIDLEPSECLSCLGEGESECLVCDGFGTQSCEECDGSGMQTCDVCDGTGGEQCSQCDGEGQLDYGFDTYSCDWCDGDGWQECTSCDAEGGWVCGWCDGWGEVDCDTCGGGGISSCDSCAGTGQPNEAMLDVYREGMSDSVFSAQVVMPGVFSRSTDSGEPSWRVRGEEGFDGLTLTAHSVLVDWVVTGIALALLVVVMGFAVVLLVRRRNQRNQVAVPAAGGMTACAGCGTMNGTDARFCGTCGTKL